jgi:hypothetical protein
MTSAQPPLLAGQQLKQAALVWSSLRKKPGRRHAYSTEDTGLRIMAAPRRGGRWSGNAEAQRPFRGPPKVTTSGEHF